MMDAKVQRLISDAVTDGTSPPDDALKELIGDDPEATAYFEQVSELEKRLRSWELVEPPRQYWKSFGSRLTSRLAAAPENNEEDPLTAPAPDDPHELEQAEASTASPAEPGEPDTEAGDGLDVLAALAGRSTLPPVKNFDDGTTGPKDDGVLDIGALMAETEKKEKARATAAAPAAECGDEASSKLAPAAPSRAAAQPQSKNSGLYIGIGLVVVALAVVGIFAINSANEAARDAVRLADNTVSLGPASTSPSLVEERGSETTTERGPQVEPPPAVESPASQTEVDDPGEGGELGSPEVGDTRVGSSRRAAAGRTAIKSSADPEAAAPTKTEPSPAVAAPTPQAKATGPTSDLDALLAGATGPIRAPAKTTAGAQGGGASDAVAAAESGEEGDAMPDQPSRSQVRRAMGSVAGQVMACRSLVQETTRVNATVTVANSGAVTSASVSGGSSDVQQCVERAVQRARFPRFTQPTFAVTYPFVLSPEE